MTICVAYAGTSKLSPRPLWSMSEAPCSTVHFQRRGTPNGCMDLVSLWISDYSNVSEFCRSRQS